MRASIFLIFSNKNRKKRFANANRFPPSPQFNQGFLPPGVETPETIFACPFPSSPHTGIDVL